MPRGEVINDEDIVARLSQQLHNMAADISGPAGNKYLHRSSFPVVIHACARKEARTRSRWIGILSQNRKNVNNFMEF
jgi:hypothetical protein